MCHFHMFLQIFTRISCFSHHSVSQENRRETIVWPLRLADEMDNVKPQVVHEKEA